MPREQDDQRFFGNSQLLSVFSNGVNDGAKKFLLRI
jgi:hypothetical protein